MPYPTDHRSKVKRKIIDSARRQFNRHGFESVSVQQIMAGAGLTHGGFYSYFKSKSDLYAEVLGCFFTDPDWKNCWEGVHVDLSSTDVGPQVVRAYLSRQHYDDVENSCPMVALPTDVARSNANARRAYHLRANVGRGEVDVHSFPAVFPVGIGEEATEYLGVQIALAFEIAVKAAVGEARASHDLLDRNTLEAMAIELSPCTINDLSFHF